MKNAKNVFASIGSLGLVAFAVLSACAHGATICTQTTEKLGGITLQTTELPGTTREDVATCNSRFGIIRSTAQLRQAYVDMGLQQPNSNPNAPIEGIPLPPIDFARQSILLYEGAHDNALRFVLASGADVTLGTQQCAGNAISRCDVKLLLVDVLVDTTKEHVCDSVDCSGAAAAQVP